MLLVCYAFVFLQKFITQVCHTLVWCFVFHHIRVYFPCIVNRVRFLHTFSSLSQCEFSSKIQVVFARTYISTLSLGLILQYMLFVFAWYIFVPIIPFGTLLLNLLWLVYFTILHVYILSPIIVIWEKRILVDFKIKFQSYTSIY